MSEKSTDEKEVVLDSIAKEEGPLGSTRRRKSYRQELAIFNGIYPTKASILTLASRPFIAWLTPVGLWASLLYGTAVSWPVVLAAAVAQIFATPRS